MSRFVVFIYRLIPHLKIKVPKIKPHLKNKNVVPVHIAIIMDGNGRWAQKRGLPRVAGHRMGAESLREAVKTCAELGVKYLTVYAFSTENWDRPKDEVDFLMTLLGETIDREVSELNKNNVRVRFLGGVERLSDSLRRKIRESMDNTGRNTGLNLNVMINYGGRAEIANALQKILNGISGGTIDKKIDITETIRKYLYTAEIPDPDLLIRTGGDKRISNFLLWQSAYAELYFTDCFWPDFGKRELILAVEDFQKRKRRFGKVL